MPLYHDGYMKRDQGQWVHDDAEARARFAEATVDAAGVVRWKSNQRVPPAECRGHWALLDLPFDAAASAAAYDAETIAALGEYSRLREMHGYSEEELAEIRSEFGNAPVVGVITGRQISPSLCQFMG